MNLMMRKGKMRKLKSCGFIIFRLKEGSESDVEFLLMKHRNRFDLCKGHFEERDKTEKRTAFRELREETSIKQKDIVVDDGFRYSSTYFPRYKRFGGEKVEKTVVIFLGILKNPKKKLVITEHQGFEWFTFKKEGNKIQRNAIDPLLNELEKYFREKSAFDHLSSLLSESTDEK